MHKPKVHGLTIKITKLNINSLISIFGCWLLFISILSSVASLSLSASSANTTATLDVSELVVQPVTLTINQALIEPGQLLVFTLGPAQNATNTILANITCRIEFDPPQLATNIIIQTITNADGLCIYRTDTALGGQNWTLIQGTVDQLVYINTPEGAGSAVGRLIYPGPIGIQISNNVAYTIDNGVDGVSGVVINPNPDNNNPNLNPNNGGGGGSIISDPSGQGGGNNLDLTPRTGGDILIGLFVGTGIALAFIMAILALKKKNLEAEEVIENKPSKIDRR